MRQIFIACLLWLIPTAVIAEQAPESGVWHYLGNDSGAFAAVRKVRSAKGEPPRKEIINSQRPVAHEAGKPADAASAPVQPAVATVKPDIVPDLGQPFDSTVSQLAAPVMGSDIRRLYSRLVSMRSEVVKQQPESAGQYLDRTASFDPCQLGTNLRCDSRLAFYERAVMETQYDAGSGTMQVIFYLTDESVFSVHRREPGRYAIKEIANNTVSERNVVWRASGETTDVLRTKGEAWAISIGVNNLEPIMAKATDQYYVCSMNFSMPAEWVAEFNEGIFGDVGLLYIGTLDTDPAYEDRDYGSAMMGMPYAKDVTRYSLKFRLDEIWVVNRSTGRIYGKRQL